MHSAEWFLCKYAEAEVRRFYHFGLRPFCKVLITLKVTSWVKVDCTSTALLILPDIAGWPRSTLSLDCRNSISVSSGSPCKLAAQETSYLGEFRWVHTSSAAAREVLRSSYATDFKGRFSVGLRFTPLILSSLKRFHAEHLAVFIILFLSYELSWEITWIPREWIDYQISSKSGGKVRNPRPRKVRKFRSNVRKAWPILHYESETPWKPLLL